MPGQQVSVSAEQPPLWLRAEELFAGWRAGDQSAMDELVRTLNPVLWQMVRAYGLNRDSADDVVQTTWLTLVRTGASIRDDRAVLRWLTVTARREAWRVSQASRRTAASDDAALEVVLPTSDSAEHAAVLDDEQRRLWRLVRELSDRCQRLLRVVAFSERPDSAGIAESLQMPVGSIGPTRARCLTKLRTLIETPGGHNERPHHHGWRGVAVGAPASLVGDDRPGTRRPGRPGAVRPRAGGPRHRLRAAAAHRAR
ncbi:MAG: sigma-70 family RNA polymerase sigma factor [Actinomycetota bacterium]|nr:sigma-70 family RNA polymerase sigma factor [Actinomycetota bacterium]